MSRLAPGVLLLAAIFLGGPTGAAPVLEFVHVAANVGGSSGGHSALKLGDFAYHYEFGSDGLLKLDRTAWADFAHHYASLENRSLRLARVPVSEAAFARVENRFARLLVVQQRHLDRLDALEREARWLEARAGGEASVPVRGAGLFADEGRDPAAHILHEAVVQRLGNGFLERERARTDAALAALADTRSATGEGALAWDSYPSPSEIAAERRRDLLELKAALIVLGESRPLAADAVLDLAEVDVEKTADLTADERARIARLARDLEDSVTRLLTSERPDRGFALLVAGARHHALRRSLAEGRLILLDPLPPDAVVLGPEAAARRRDSLRELAAYQERVYRGVRAEALGADAPGELDLRLLEQAVSRYYQAQGGAAQGRAVRGSVDPSLVPAREGALRATPSPHPEEATREAEAARAEATRERERLGALYGYSLLGHNCATELVRGLESAFDGAEHARAELGGTLVPGAGLGFIPAGLGGRVERRLAVSETAVVPSYRERALQAMAQREHPLVVGLRESSTLTSSVYRPTDADGAFLFFTDGVAPLRPALGTLNLGYGLLHALAGLITLPFDAGHRLVQGLHGATFSVPELFFVNIRKGTFEFVPREDP